MSDKSNKQLTEPFWEKHNCPNCLEKLYQCKCKLNYCPFCNAKFGFVQDWNIHLIKDHQYELLSTHSKQKERNEN